MRISKNGSCVVSVLFRSLLALLLVAGLSGCGANMALTKGQDKLEMSDNGVVLATVRIANQNKPGYQPILRLAFLQQLAPVNERLTFKINDDPYKAVKEQYNEYLLSFGLKPGDYSLNSLFGTYNIPLLVSATCSVNCNAPFTVKQGVVSYLGNIQATIVERKGDEDRAGPLVPLIDQSVAGFSNGTFELKIIDRYEEDLAAYQAEYPALKGVKIEKQLLPTVTKSAMK